MINDDASSVPDDDGKVQYLNESLDSTPPAQRGSAAAAAAALAQKEDPSPGDYFALRLYGLRVVAHRLSLAADVAADIVDEAMAKFVSACSDREVHANTALPYFRRIVQNEAIDRLRRRHELPVGDLDDEADTDDAIARIIDKAVSAHTIERLQRAAAERGDTTTTRVLNAFMNLAEAKRRRPTTREVGGAAQMSHQTVQNVLRRLRDELGPGDGYL